MAPDAAAYEGAAAEGVKYVIPNYDAYRQNKIESGLLYQDFIVDLMLQVLRFPVTIYSSRLYQMTVGEGPAGVEIKHDEKFARTGNLWIEVAEKARPRRGDYVPSGIFRDDNSWLYIIGNYDLVFVFTKVLLQAFASTDRYPIRENLTGTSKGFLLPDAVARRCAARVQHVLRVCNVCCVYAYKKRIPAASADDGSDPNRHFSSVPFFAAAWRISRRTTSGTLTRSRRARS